MSVRERADISRTKALEISVISILSLPLSSNGVRFAISRNSSKTSPLASIVLVLDYLQTVNSRLVADFEKLSLFELLSQMDLLVGPVERQLVKNVAAMMFCKNPAKFFPTTQVDIVIFPEGCIKNPNNMIEVPKIVGPVPDMIKQALDYIKTNVIKKRIIKQKDKA